MNLEKFKNCLNTVKNTAGFTREIGVDRSYYYKLRDGSCKIGVDLLEKFALRQAAETLCVSLRQR